MTAASVFVMQDCVHLVTDGAGYDRDGNVCGLLQKVTIVPHLGCAVVTRGHTDVSRWVAGLVMNIPKASLIEDFLSAGCHGEFGDRAAAHPEHWGFDAIVAGVRGGKPFAVLVSSHHRPEHAPFEPLDITAAWSAPPVKRSVLAEVYQQVRILPKTGALTLIEAQSGSDECPVGGYGQLTTVWADRVETSLLRQFR